MFRCVLSCDGHISSINEKNAHDLLLHVRHIKISQASNWPSHTSNRLDTGVAGRMRLNHIGTRCAVLITCTESI